MINKFVEDTLIFPKAEHVHYVWGVLQCLLQTHLYVKAEKCEFHSPSVSFLGFILSAVNMKMEWEQ